MSDWPGPRGSERSMSLEQFEIFQKAQEKMKLAREAELAETYQRGWNEAIEAAAKEALTNKGDGTDIAGCIRALKAPSPLNHKGP